MDDENIQPCGQKWHAPGAHLTGLDTSLIGLTLDVTEVSVWEQLPEGRWIRQIIAHLAG